MPKYPKEMYLSDEPINSEKEVYKSIVYFEKELDGENYYFSKCINLGICAWRYAVELDHFEKQVKEITIEEIAQRFGYPIEQISIKK